MNLYNKFLRKVVMDLGNGITYNDQLTEYCHKFLPRSVNFLGVHPQNFDSRILDNYRKCCLIINTAKSNEQGVHWVAIWKEDPDIYYFDSFGRNPEKLVPIFNRRVGGDVIYDDDAIQKNYEDNCGQRCVAWLLVCAKYGIKNAIKI